MKPNYDAMSWADLRAYILDHRDDLDALDAMYARRSPDQEATWFSPPQNLQEWEQQASTLKPLFQKG
jgi:erythromycin esterase-like protein